MQDLTQIKETGGVSIVGVLCSVIIFIFLWWTFFGALIGIVGFFYSLLRKVEYVCADCGQPTIRKAIKCGSCGAKFK